MQAVEVLASHGIQRAAEVVERAAAAGLELAAAATLLEKESGGGHNVWGHDDVDTGGNYEKGAPVTREAYLNYKADRKRLGAQGVGPTQLTFPPFQDEADERGGCWDWRVNCLVGFEILAGNMRANGVRDGFRAYNGSGPRAERYADDAMSKLATWRSRLGGAQGLALFPQEEEDMTPEQARQLEAVFKGLTVQGTSSPNETVDMMFQRIKRIEAALAFQQQSAEEAFSKLFERVRDIHNFVLDQQKTS